MLPLDELVWPRANGVLGQPRITLLLSQLLGDHLEVLQPLGEDRVRLLGLHVDCVVVDDVDPGDLGVVTHLLALLVRVGDAIPVPLDGRGGERITVVELDVRPQLHLPDGRLDVLPALRQPGLDLVRLAVADAEIIVGMVEEDNACAQVVHVWVHRRQVVLVEDDSQHPALGRRPTCRSGRAACRRGGPTRRSSRAACWRRCAARRSSRRSTAAGRVLGAAAASGQQSADTRRAGPDHHRLHQRPTIDTAFSIESLPVRVDLVIEVLGITLAHVATSPKVTHNRPASHSPHEQQHGLRADHGTADYTDARRSLSIRQHSNDETMKICTGYCAGAGHWERQCRSQRPSVG